MSGQKTVVLGVSGSIAAYKSADIIRRLQEKGLKVTVVMSKDAENFITPLTLSCLAGEDVIRDDFDAPGAWTMAHITLAKKADCFLIAPATANTIAKIALGMADSVLTCAALGTKAPLLIAPAMNTEMYHSSAVQKNCETLRERGVIFIGPSEGQLACGITGEGHLSEEDEIVDAVLQSLK